MAPIGAVGAGHVLLGRDQAVLGPTDRAGDGFRRRVREFDLALAQHFLQHPPAVVRIVDRVVLVQAHQRRVSPQQAGAERMERPHPHASALRQPLDALPHLVGRLVGERQGQDLTGRDAVQQQVRDAVRDDPRLAAAGAGQDQQGTVQVRSRLALNRRQPGQQIGGVGDVGQSVHASSLDVELATVVFSTNEPFGLRTGHPDRR